MTYSPRKSRILNKLILLFISINLALINSVVRILRFLIFKKIDNPRKILIFRTGSLGDSICAIPSIIKINRFYPNSEIHILTNVGLGKNLVSLSRILPNNYYNRIINYEPSKWRSLGLLLRLEKYDLVIHLTQQGSPLVKHIRDMLYFRYLAGIPCGGGWEKNTFFLFRKVQDIFCNLENEQTRLSRILQNQFSIIPSLNESYEFNFKEDDCEIVNKKINQAVFDLNRKAISIVIGAKRSTNRWPISYFYETVKQFCSEFNIYIIGGIDDIGLSQTLLSLPNTYSFCGELTPSQSALLMKKCILTLSNDTGPMHLSYSSGTPVVALFSNRDFSNLWYPPNDGKNIVHRASGISCSLCLLENCPNDNLCMKQISVDQVVNSLKKITQYSKSGY